MHAAFTLIAHALSACFRSRVLWRSLIASGVIVGLVLLPLPLLAVGNYHGQDARIAPVQLKSMTKIVPFLCGAPFFQKTAFAIALTLGCLGLGCIGALDPDFSS